MSDCPTQLRVVDVIAQSYSYRLRQATGTRTIRADDLHMEENKMSISHSTKLRFVALSIACLALAAGSVHAQQRGGTPQTDQVKPVNSGANPYRATLDWAKIDSEARPWGGSNGVAIDRDGKTVWATDR